MKRSRLSDFEKLNAQLIWARKNVEFVWNALPADHFEGIKLFWTA